MSFFSLIQKKGSKPIPPAPNSIRKEVVYSIPNARSTLNANPSRLKFVPPKVGAVRQKVNTSQVNGALRKHARRRKRSPQTRLVSDSDSEGLDTAEDVPRKRTKIVKSAGPLVRRQLRCPTTVSEDDCGIPPVVQAADIASLDKPSKYRLAFSQELEDHAIELQYPSASQRERYIHMATLDNSAVPDAMQI